MNVSDFRKRVKEMIEKTEEGDTKKPAPSGQSSKSQKDFDDAKVGMSFLILKNCLIASEYLAESMGADMTGLQANCMEDPLLVTAWDAYSRDMLSNREFSPGMMVCFCLSSQMLYTYRKNTSQFKKDAPSPEEDPAPETGEKRQREDEGSGNQYDDGGDYDIHPSQDGLHVRPPTPPRASGRPRQPPAKKRAKTATKTYNFEDYSAEDLGSDDTTSDEE